MSFCRRSLTVSGALIATLAVPLLAPAAHADEVPTAPLVTVEAPADAPAVPVEAPVAPVEAPPVQVEAPAVSVDAAPAAPVVLGPPAPQATLSGLTPTRILSKSLRQQLLRRRAATSSAPAAPAALTVAPPANPLAGKRLYVAAATSAGREADRVRSTDPARAKGLDMIASQPTGYWWGDWNPTSTVRAEVSRHISTATAGGAVPVYVVYNIMKRDGSGYSAGGAASLAAYRAWVDQFVAGIGSRDAIVVVEPDAVNDLYNMTGTLRAERAAALRYTLTKLKAAGVPAYLDAGGPSIHAPTIVSKLLVEAGIDLAQGFAVNVSNFQTTTDNITWGKAVSAQVGGKHFVIDTGRNGNGAIPYAQDPQYWCNPPGRALGRVPTTSTGHSLVDAFLWVKQPGESDGECRGFGPAGTFSADYAYGLYARMAR